MGWLFILSLIVFEVGVTGFTKKGLRFSAKRRIKGKGAIAIGGVCTGLALVGLLLALLLGAPAERTVMGAMLVGVGIGGCGVWLAMID